jgi:hypothetical protein
MLWGTITPGEQTAGCSNGPSEAINLLIKKAKRVGHGFRNFANYRLRLLLHCGIGWQTHRTARLRPLLGGVEPARFLVSCDRGVTIIMLPARGTSSLSARARYVWATMTTCGHSCW